MARVGVVVIGRNEGERLKRCLATLAGQSVVYVDSGSTDGSPDAARAAGAEVVDLDLSIPFTAARARNAGFERLGDVEYVQFVDSDCEVAPGWLDRATAELDADPDLAVVCGRRREKFPERSAYNRLCDKEWDTPVGDASACGGDAMMRASMFREVGGYRESLIAGEEPELCLRLRMKGWKVRRLDAEMTRHDAAMTRFGQWWKRNVRAGHAYAEVSRLHKDSPMRMWNREYWSNWFWGLAMLPFSPVVYPLQMLRLSLRHGPTYAFFVVLGKVPQMIGQWKYLTNKRRGRAGKLIEYKG